MTTTTEINSTIERATERGPGEVTGVRVAYLLGSETRDGFPRWAVYAVFGDGSHVLRAFHAVRGEQTAYVYADKVAAALGVPVL